MRWKPTLLLSFAVVGLAFSARGDERLIVLNKSDDTASILDAVSGKALATILVGHGPHEVAVLAGGRTAAVADYGDRGRPGRTITLIDLGKNAKAGSIELPEGA